MANGFKILWTDNALEVRKAVILKYNTLYYRIKKNTIEILSFFSNRQNPAKAKF